MTADAFIRSLLPLLPVRREEALGQIEGWLLAVREFGGASKADLAAIIRARTEIQAGRMPEVAR